MTITKKNLNRRQSFYRLRLARLVECERCYAPATEGRFCYWHWRHYISELY